MHGTNRYITQVLIFASLNVFGLGCSGSESALREKEAAHLLERSGNMFLPAPAFAQAGNEMIADVAENSVDKVVNIYSEKVTKTEGEIPFGPFFHDPFFENFFGNRFHGNMIPKERRERSLGSGVVFDDKGTIVTNHHVIEKAEKIQVMFNNKKVYDAEVVGSDKETDLAVLRLKGKVKGLEPFVFGDSNEMRLGDIVLAIGNPFGVGNTVTMGIVSAKGRADVGIVDYEDFIQTDAAINPGNSGGALINTRGELIGINTAILSRSGGYQGIGFAIPSTMVNSIVGSLLSTGKVVRGWLGVSIQDIDQNLSKAMGLPDTKGVLISDVMDNSPAHKAGLKRGDVVLEMNDESLESAAELRNLVATAGADVRVELKIFRDGKKRTLSVTLGKKESEEISSAATQEDKDVLGGLTVESLTNNNRAKYHISKEVKYGVLVTNVIGGTAAQFAGLQPGDVIQEVNRKAVKSVKDLERFYNDAEDVVAFLVRRGDISIYLAFHKE